MARFEVFQSLCFLDPADTQAQIFAMSQCPVQQAGKLTSSTTARCPVSQNPDNVNPVNNVPWNLSQSPAPNQSISLSTKRKKSSIPCATSSEPDPADSSSSTWVYPSPQQFYNALTRKGYEMPQDQMDTMVQLHNFLNEEAWADVLRWEARWQRSFAAPTLVQICGKPRELSFKARGLLVAGWLLPSWFASVRPFDRHDWLVRRASGREVRYIIDYYRAPPDELGNPAFALDVRPASDNVDNIRQRVSTAAGGLWSSLFTKSSN
ncbi:cytochrome c/c1 heme-lyase [Mycena alexandri]|uniref:Holocytochrome c-type synthase n=1 Tax=Mycena alexandri TaxID=1745969 RepID=A0AAD6SB36_9AGAR|nr:cytochrome c/c1 heme-lyase [Mycena alexandri]